MDLAQSVETKSQHKNQFHFQISATIRIQILRNDTIYIHIKDQIPRTKSNKIQKLSITENYVLQSRSSLCLYVHVHTHTKKEKEIEENLKKWKD